jgi:hypothetical protein
MPARYINIWFSAEDGDHWLPKYAGLVIDTLPRDERMTKARLSAKGPEVEVEIIGAYRHGDRAGEWDCWQVCVDRTPWKRRGRGYEVRYPDGSEA